MKRVSILVAAILIAKCASADQVTLDFTGVVTNLTQGGPPEFPDVGDPVTGYVTYDLSTPDIDPRFDTGTYEPNIPGGLTIQVGSLRISSDEYFVSVFNRLPGEGPWDGLAFGGTSPPLFGSPSETTTSIGFYELRDVFNSSALPETFDLSQLERNAGGSILDNDTHIWRFDFDVLSLRSRPVPEPSSVVCLGVALTGLVGWRSASRRVDGKRMVRCGRAN